MTPGCAPRPPRTPASRARRARAGRSPAPQTPPTAETGAPRARSSRSRGRLSAWNPSALLLVGALWLQVVREVGQVLEAVFGDEDEVLQPAPAEALPVDPWLDGDDVAGDELVLVDQPQPGILV